MDILKYICIVSKKYDNDKIRHFWSKIIKTLKYETFMIIYDAQVRKTIIILVFVAAFFCVDDVKVLIKIFFPVCIPNLTLSSISCLYIVLC